MVLEVCGSPVIVAALQRGDVLRGPDGDVEVLKVKAYARPALEQDIIDLYIPNAVIPMTSSHRIMIEGSRGPVARCAGELKTGDHLMTSDGAVEVSIQRRSAVVPFFEVMLYKDRCVFLLPAPLAITYGTQDADVFAESSCATIRSTFIDFCNLIEPQPRRCHSAPPSLCNGSVDARDQNAEEL